MLLIFSGLARAARCEISLANDCQFGMMLAASFRIDCFGIVAGVVVAVVVVAPGVVAAAAAAAAAAELLLLLALPAACHIMHGVGCTWPSAEYAFATDPFRLDCQ